MTGIVIALVELIIICGMSIATALYVPWRVKMDLRVQYEIFRADFSDRLNGR
jgi:hypothetical protein